MSKSKRTEERTPVLRPRARAEELAKLHPVERLLYRLLEFLASLKLAIILMVWLMVECAIGTRVESTINAAAAQYFVYSNTRFYLLLSLLALNVACAALIRYPWKRYQIGFLVTHTGLLLILAGSFGTAMFNVDSLLAVAKGQINDSMIDPDEETLAFTLSTVNKESGAADSATQELSVAFGPLTWGTKILDVVPWRKGHEETYPLADLQRGASVTVKRFFAHCEPEQVYRPSEIGVPAVHFTMNAPQMGFKQDLWLSANMTQLGYIHDDQVSVGGMPVRVRYWQVESQAELDHFVQASPKGPIKGLIGQLGYSHNGKHHLITVDDLEKQPFEPGGGDLKIELVEYIPHAELNRATNKFEKVGDLPRFPIVQLRITTGGQSHDLIVMANHPELSPALAKRAGLGEDLATFFRADQPTEIQLVSTRGEQLGYRTFGASQGCLASVLVEMGKSYPCFGIFEFVPRQVIAQASPDLELIPRPIPPGQQTMPGVELEVTLRDGTKGIAHVVREGRAMPIFLGNAMVQVQYRIRKESLPFAIRLDDFNQPNQPGTMAAARYESFVTILEKIGKPTGAKDEVIDPANRNVAYREVGKAEIKMNHPLFHRAEDGREYTLFQSGIQQIDGVPLSTFTVARDPGLITKYIGAVVLCVGILLMFTMGGYFRRTPAKKKKAVATNSNSAGMPAPDQVPASV